MAGFSLPELEPVLSVSHGNRVMFPNKSQFAVRESSVAGCRCYLVVVVIIVVMVVRFSSAHSLRALRLKGFRFS